MINIVLLWLSTVVLVCFADGLARPRADRASLYARRPAGLWIIALAASISFGAILAVTGNRWLAFGLSASLGLLVTLASNAKRRVLGEPLLFSDLALARAIVKHPQFYFTVLPLWQQVVLAGAVLAALAVLIWLSHPGLAMAIYGIGLALGGLVLMAVTSRMKPWSELARRPDADADVQALGLVPTVLLYWRRWKTARAALSSADLKAIDPVSKPSLTGAEGEEILIVVQCESFADPQELFASGGTALPELTRARANAVQWGRLEVSGFGAYTMRTEYGVLFGREEADLGFLLYDPYLTALEDPALALPQKLGLESWTSHFVHPHDMRFYGRDQILPKAGFTALVGEEAFAPPDRTKSRYVRDADVADKILGLARAASSPTFIYAVTMENHGPWAPHGDASTSSMVDNYNRLVLAGDAMLGQLREGLEALGKPATLVFFGDHRPTIPGASDPGGDRHTPYVIVRCGPGAGDAASERRDLSPAQLHQSILEWAKAP